MANHSTHPWSQKDVLFLQRNYFRLNTRQICQTLQRSYDSVITKAHDLGLRKFPKEPISSEHPIEVLAYTAGLIDADGCISILRTKPSERNKRGKWTLRLSIINTDESIPLWLNEHFIGSTIHRERLDRNWKARFDWYLSGEDASNLLKLCLPFLIRKVEQAKVAILFQDTIGSKRTYWRLPIKVARRREQFYQELKRLNKVGKN